MGVIGYRATRPLLWATLILWGLSYRSAYRVHDCHDNFPGLARLFPFLGFRLVVNFPLLLHSWMENSI